MAEADERVREIVMIAAAEASASQRLFWSERDIAAIAAEAASDRTILRNVRHSKEAALSALTAFLLEHRTRRRRYLETTPNGNRIWRKNDPTGYRTFVKAKAKHRQAVQWAKRFGHEPNPGYF